MSQFSAADFDAKAYFSYRPTYPDSFYSLLDRYHEGRRKLAVDVGCGPGVATFQLADRLNSFDQIIGTDISSTMVERANVWKNSEPDKFARVSFGVSSAEEFAFLGSDLEDKRACDLITAVECAHWLDFSKFQKAASVNLRKGGTLAVWGYGDAFFPEFPKIDQLILDLTYDEGQLGPYWDQPGRTYLKNLYQDLRMDDTIFTDIEDVVFTEEDIRSKDYVNSEPVPLFMSKPVTLQEYKYYIYTWSAYHSWKKDHPYPHHDIGDEFVDQVLKLYPELSRTTKIQICWKTFYKFARAL